MHMKNKAVAGLTTVYHLAALIATVILASGLTPPLLLLPSIHQHSPYRMKKKEKAPQLFMVFFLPENK